MSLDRDDSDELRWIRQALEEHNTLIANQNKLLTEIVNKLDKIYMGLP